MLSEMQRVVQRQMLKDHVGYRMFCPACRAVMDCRRAVSADVLKDGELAKTYCLCVECWDKAHKDLRAIVAKNPGYSLEVADGRELFARPPRKSRQAVSARQAGCV